MPIKKNYIVAKRNVLNELRANSMTLQELRFFTIYLGKINSKEPSTRVVRFLLSEFQKIMELDRLNIDYLKQITDRLLSKIVHVPLNEKGSYEAFQLFKKCKIDTNEYDEWYLEIDAHDSALPLMFEFKDKYFTYELWNALCLKSSNQLRMYEILKQYQKVGERILSIEELKELLGIKKNEYERYSNLKIHVLDVCQKALKNSTDIQFTYKPIRGKGRGGKIQFLKFTITKNNSYTNQLSLEDFIDLNSGDLKEYSEIQEQAPHFLNFYFLACNNEFSPAEMQVIYNMVIQILPPSAHDTDIYDYIKRKYDEFLYQAERTKIKHRFGYLKKIIEADF